MNPDYYPPAGPSTLCLELHMFTRHSRKEVVSALTRKGWSSWVRVKSRPPKKLDCRHLGKRKR